MTLENYIKFLESEKISHTREICNNSTTIKLNGGGTFFFSTSGEKIEAKYLSFITKVKREIISNSKFDKEKEPKYIKFSPVFSGNFFEKDVTEIDINGAYWFTAFDMGLISESTYNEGLSVPKKIRLMAFGSCATVKEVWKFVEGEGEYIGIEFSEQGRRAFFEVAQRVDNVMKFVFESLMGFALFYWVDAIFVKTEFKDYAVSIINSFGYETKIVNIAWCRGCAVKNTIEAMTYKEGEVFFEFERKIYFKKKKKNDKKNRKKRIFAAINKQIQ